MVVLGRNDRAMLHSLRRCHCIYGDCYLLLWVGVWVRDEGEGEGLDLGNGPEVLGVVLSERIHFVGCSLAVVRGKVGYYYQLIVGNGLFGNQVLFYYRVCPVMVQ